MALASMDAGTATAATQPQRQTPLDTQRITEQDATMARIHARCVQRPRASIATLVADLRARVMPVHTVHSAFIARHTTILRDAYIQANMAGQRDYYEVWVVTSTCCGRYWRLVRLSSTSGVIGISACVCHSPGDDAVHQVAIIGRACHCKAFSRRDSLEKTKYLTDVEIFPHGPEPELVAPHFLTMEALDAICESLEASSQEHAADMYAYFVAEREAAIIAEIRRVCGVVVGEEVEESVQGPAVSI